MTYAIEKGVPVPPDACITDAAELPDGAFAYRMLLPYPAPVVEPGHRLSPWETVESVAYLPHGIELVVRDTAPPDPESFL